MTRPAPDFLWGAATSPHQVEGNNLNSDAWAREYFGPGREPSGDACDSYHRYGEDMRLLADAGLTAYRFGVEWARIEPVPGHVSRAELAHYRRMIETAQRLGLEPVVTLHHFTSPNWFAQEGGWSGERAIERFGNYVQAVTGILDGVKWICTMNEPNMLAVMEPLSRQLLSEDDGGTKKWTSPTVEGAVHPVLPEPDPQAGRRFIEAHHAARDLLKKHTDAAIGWTVACQALTATPGNEGKLRELRYGYEDLYLEAARGDDFVGVQSYSSQSVDENGIVPHPPGPDTTLTGQAYRPDAIGIAVRHVWETTGGVPILITENGIATADDTRRIRYTTEALGHLFAAIDDGIDVRGYLHWSALDNYEWGHWEPTFGLIAVDRETFERRPKPSLAWLGEVARRGRP
ncbi:family 1 glycosylhydrolase [Streptomyces sp. Li-HN-5-11]|uniref:family 1 glycosylhydrolase n=1 Tax=Streptomyces sp. Li-HN-5-11 TaxID=3075432 RepID=UPI0028A8C9AE|nr:family 1 glycosylhydrolase [Streptomyces sp. Li-HN-5-11]WNM31936.1 family 1 glycosylhydrolase [Streptomyces sp. Li-HN-5-11]